MKQSAVCFGTILALLFALGCRPPEPEEINPNRKNIVSTMGEVTRSARYVGETVRYRIHYKNISSRTTDIRIIDKVDAALGEVQVFNDGSYSGSFGSIVWTIEDVPAGSLGLVEFEARIQESGVIRNQAIIQFGTRKLFEDHSPGKRIETKDKESIEPGDRIRDHSRINEVVTNTVTVDVCDAPKLGWIPFTEEDRVGDSARANMKDETTTTTTVNFVIPGMYVHETVAEDVIFHRLSIPGRAHRQDIGKPELPLVGEVIEVPHGVDFKPEIIRSESISLDCYNVYPAQEPETDQLLHRRPFVQDKQTYLQDRDFPGELVEFQVEEIGIIRGHRVVFLKVNPLQYNPVTREMRAFSNIEVRLNFDRPAQVEAVPERIRSTAFEELVHATVLNPVDTDRYPAEDAPTGGEDKKQGCDYLIITHGDFFNATDANNPIIRFRNWKQQKGHRTQVVDVANIPGGSSDDDIKAYLQDAYDNWSPPPTYVLIVGDAEKVPTHYDGSNGHPTDHAGTDVGTDLYYATLDGTDYFPDLFVGRISVDTAQEAQDVIDKVIAYEKNPPAQAAFYDDATLIVLFEDVDPDLPPLGAPPRGNGREDRPWVENVEEVFDFLDNNGYNPERIVNRSGNQNPQWYKNGNALPAALAGLAWTGNAADISAAINTGRFLVTYRDHGGRDDWSAPFRFDNGDVNALTNGDLTPVVFSIACQNGWFDNETDDAGLGTNAGDECLGETFQRHNNGGAVAFIGATRNSWTGTNDFFMFGLHKAIWPRFDPNPPLSGYPGIPVMETSPLVKMGQTHTFGKIYTAKAYSHSSKRLALFEMYHLFGDPEMPMWTDEPGELKVEHPDGFGATGEQDFVVRVMDNAGLDPVPSATVVLTRDDTILAVRSTNPAGLARFTVNAPGQGDVLVTVTLHNYRPYEGTMVVKPGGAVLNRLDPEDGTENQTIHVGGKDFTGAEIVDVSFGGQQMVTPQADGGSFGQTGMADVDITVPSPYDLGPVNVVARGQTSNRYGVDVFQVRSRNPIDLYTYSQWDVTTWHLFTDTNPTWDNPEIQIYDSADNPVESNNLTVGTTYTIKAKVHNDTDFDAQGVQVSFKWANFGVGQPDRVWEAIRTNNLTFVEIDVNAQTTVEAEVQWTPSNTGHLCVLAEIYHVEDINSDNNRGQENCHVGPTSSPAEIKFLVWNPTDQPAMVHLELRQQLGEENEEKGQVLWGSLIRHPDPQLLLPGESREAVVIIDPDLAGVKIRPGQEAVFALTGFVDGKVIGGANFRIRKR